jgi:hypothetical protein
MSFFSQLFTEHLIISRVTLAFRATQFGQRYHTHTTEETQPRCGENQAPGFPVFTSVTSILLNSFNSVLGADLKADSIT